MLSSGEQLAKDLRTVSTAAVRSLDEVLREAGSSSCAPEGLLLRGSVKRTPGEVVGWVDGGRGGEGKGREEGCFKKVGLMGNTMREGVSEGRG